MRPFLDLSLTVVIALVAGLGSALIVLDDRAAGGPIVVGPWMARPVGSPASADPYEAAAAATAVDLPLGAAEGIMFTALTDSGGEPLSANCDYTLVGDALPGRLWTLTAYDGNGQVMDNPSGRTGYHSREVLRRFDGSFVIAVAAMPQPGNWLPIDSQTGLRLVLRLYDTPLTTGFLPADLLLPGITRGSCR